MGYPIAHFLAWGDASTIVLKPVSKRDFLSSGSWNFAWMHLLTISGASVSEMVGFRPGKSLQSLFISAGTLVSRTCLAT